MSTKDPIVRIQLAVTWFAPAMAIMLLVGFGAVAGWLPPPAANETAQQVATMYRTDHTRILAGTSIMFAAWTMWGPLVALISYQLGRIRGATSLFPLMQLVCGAAGWIFIALPTLMMIVVAFDPDRPAEETLALHQLAWICFILPVTTFIAQFVTIAVAILCDNGPDPLFSRWLAYFHLWAALGAAPALALPFFRTGPLAWNGVFVFWIPFVIFGTWFIVIFFALRRAVRHGSPVRPEARDASPVPS